MRRSHLTALVTALGVVAGAALGAYGVVAAPADRPLGEPVTVTPRDDATAEPDAAAPTIPSAGPTPGPTTPAPTPTASPGAPAVVEPAPAGPPPVDDHGGDRGSDGPGDDEPDNRDDRDDRGGGGDGAPVVLVGGAVVGRRGRRRLLRDGSGGERGGGADPERPQGSGHDGDGASVHGGLLSWGPTRRGPVLLC
ncbi:hypothetical protein [Actinotalea sp. Marseille-Q4924]|uniref:hypothetical protein n=1 Tax=Actinotalea sp. Marseille-Q4924 TaxID=2866571 RepID=UPI001CE41E00|nr:hypothetical protein [Actinotalea sp. Marseille-Q4924]